MKIENMRSVKAEWDYPAWGIGWGRKDNLPPHWKGAENNIYGAGIPWAYSREECQKECERLNIEQPALWHRPIFTRGNSHCQFARTMRKDIPMTHIDTAHGIEETFTDRELRAARAQVALYMNLWLSAERDLEELRQYLDECTNSLFHTELAIAESVRDELDRLTGNAKRKEG